jgi:hypothetical protein
LLIHLNKFDSSYNIPHARNLSLPVISRKPNSPTILSAACGVTPSILDRAGMHKRPRHGQLDQFRQF